MHKPVNLLSVPMYEMSRTQSSQPVYPPDFARYRDSAWSKGKCSGFNKKESFHHTLKNLHLVMWENIPNLPRYKTYLSNISPCPSWHCLPLPQLHTSVSSTTSRLFLLIFSAIELNEYFTQNFILCRRKLTLHFKKNFHG